MLTPEQAVFTAILTCLAGAGLTLLASRDRAIAGWISFAVTLGTAALVLGAATSVLVSGPAHPAQFWAMPRFGFALRIYVDGLTAVFLILVAVVALPAALYSIPYMRHYPGYGVGRYYPYFLLFLAAMYGLVSTTDMMWFFFIFWQMMTLPGYALIRFEHRNPASVRAARKFLIMMQIACAATMIGAELLALAGAAATSSASLKYDFDSVSQSLPALLRTRGTVMTVAFGLFLLGFGIKMGMWPFGQVWLPDAHPAAPSPVSAMLSGVMIKTGVYGLMRYFLWLVPAEAQADYPLAGWGCLVALLGTATLLTGTAQALKQEQSKRLLAFHSIGQVGYILLGIGACLALLPGGTTRTTTLATLALLGALFHTVNHALFKGLLFLNAGSLLYATGTQDLNRMGGLTRFMPWTAAATLVASLSIAGVPLFNGFTSKWTLYVATAQGGDTARYLPVCAAIAILTSALTLASFIKFYGVSFLSRPSRWVLDRANAAISLEVGWRMRGAQLFLAWLCCLIGLVPWLALAGLERALDASRQGLGVILAGAAGAVGPAAGGMSALAGQAVFVPWVLLALLGGLFLMARGLARLGGASRRVDGPWLCGYAREAEVHRYTAHHLYGATKRWIHWLGANPKRASGSEPALRPEPPAKSS